MSVEVDIGGLGFGWGDITPANIGKAARKRIQKEIDNATVTVNLPEINLPSTVTLRRGEGSSTPDANGNLLEDAFESAKGNNDFIYLGIAAVVLFFVVKK